jgi:hypothetical protein
MFWDHKFLSDVAGCQKTQLLDCTSSTVFEKQLIISDFFLYLLNRERIKDSCDQLRVLLPYIRGRKTDMASILEMCVDYLKLVNAALPQDFQNQVNCHRRMLLSDQWISFFFLFLRKMFGNKICQA